MNFDSLILAGFSGVGKDTLVNLLKKDFPQVYNVKFSSLTKDILASTFRVPREWLDGLDGSPKWRDTPLYANGKLTEVTPLLLLQALFYGAPHTSLHKLNIEYALNDIPPDSFPVFTDVRRQEELDAIKSSGWNPLFIYLRRRDVEPGEADTHILELAEENADVYLNLYKEDINRGLESIVKCLTEKYNTTLAPRKPTLYLFVGIQPQKAYICNPNIYSLPNYEPMLTLLNKCREALGFAFNLPSDVVDKRTVDLFQALINEADLSKLELPTIETDCWMSYNDSYRPLLPRLREMANLNFYLQSGNNTSVWYSMTTEEQRDANFI